MIAHVLILVLVIAFAAALALLADRRRRARSQPDPEFGSAMSFVGSAYGLLLGLLVSFAVGHFSTARTQAQQEATSVASVWDSLGAYPPATGNPVKHTLVCYMHSVINDSWPAMEQGNPAEAPRTRVLGDNLRRQIRALPQNTKEEGSAYGRVGSYLTEAEAARQRLIFLSEPEIPNALWVVIYVGAGLVFLMLTLHYASHTAGRAWALGSVATLMVVVISVLSMLDQPFGVGVRVSPDRMHQTINLLLAGEPYEKVLTQPCRST